ncbi:MAG: CHASE domain-containing protein, partial [Gammaproteobacteria bacterium]|nr:CHASE domain-containing protein [Gammaproteobacteria bacterium]
MAANRNSQTARDAANNRSFADIFHNEYTAWVILGISLLITAFAWYVSSKYVERRAQERFAFAVEDARQRIVNRMEHFQQVLRSGVSLFATLNGGPSRQQWRTYVSNLAIQKLYPGIQGIGYAVMLDPAEVASHIASVRNDG